MKAKRKLEKSSLTILPGIGIGVGASLVTNLVVTFLVAALIVSEKIQPMAAAWCMFIANAVSVMVGCFAANVIAGKKVLLVSGLVLAVYLCVKALLGLVLLAGKMDSPLLFLLSAVAGGSASTAISAWKGKCRKKLPRRYR